MGRGALESEMERPEPLGRGSHGPELHFAQPPYLRERVSVCVREKQRQGVRGKRERE